MLIVKKTPVSIVDNFIILNQKRYRQIVQIQDYLAEGCSNREVARRLGISRNTVARYASGDPGVLAETGFRQGKLDIYITDILTCLNNGKTKKETLEHLQSKGYTGSSSNTYEYFQKIEEITGVKFELHPYVRTKTSALKNKVGSIGENCDYITRTGVFRFLWMNGNLTREHKDYIFMKYPILFKINKCIQDFRKIFETKNMPLLYLFIDEYMQCELPGIKSFASGLSKDIEAVENAVASNLSNGFVEVLIVNSRW